MTARKTITIGFIAASAVLALAALSWACTPSAYLYPVSPQAGPAGSEVTVRGGQFGNGPVEIRWSSMNGRLLATALGPEFTTKVTIPDKAAGVHYLVAVARDPADPSKVLARRAEAFQLASRTGPGGAASDAVWGDTRQAPVQGQDRFPTAALAGIVLAATAGVAGLFAAAAIRRKKAEIA